LPDPAKANGTAVLVVPGGGHRLLVTTTEGEAVGKWLNARGVAAFVLRYRLFREEGTPYSLEDARADTERSMRFIRAHASRFHVDPKRVGVIGFSAGGELARMITLSAPVRARGKGDAIDLLSARPDFSILIYPGGVVSRGTDQLAPEIRVTSQTPQTFLAVATDDRLAENSVQLYLALKRAGVPVEAHFYGTGGHGFGMYPKETTSTGWFDAFTSWMRMHGWLKPAN
jgi:acetyl esterase/lipase